MPAHVKSPKKDCADCKAGVCMAHGGEVMHKNGKGEREVAGESGHSRGVHWQNRGVGSEAGTSHAGMHVKTSSRFPSEIRDEHKSVLRELKSMKGPTSGRSGFAEGGEVEPDSDDHEIHSALGEELSQALHSKNHKHVHDSIEAIVLNCLSKKGDK